MSDYMQEAVERIARKFLSGNSVPVDIARVTREEWESLLAHIERGQKLDGWRDAPAAPDQSAQKGGA